MAPVQELPSPCAHCGHMSRQAGADLAAAAGLALTSSTMRSKVPPSASRWKSSSSSSSSTACDHARTVKTVLRGQSGALGDAAWA